MSNFRRIFLALVFSLLSFAGFAQAPEKTITWKVSVNDLGNSAYEIVFNGKIVDGWHTYSTTDPYSAPSVEIEGADWFTAEGKLYDISKPEEHNGELHFYKKVTLGQRIIVKSKPNSDIKGCLTWSSCNDTFCAAPEDFDFSATIPFATEPTHADNGAANKVTKADKADTKEGTDSVKEEDLSAKDEAESADGQAIEDSDSKATSTDAQTIQTDSSAQDTGSSIWSLILEAILWGLAMILTPCVFPMVPMTVSFFMKGSSTPAVGRFKAFMYGLFIVLLYTVPISAIIGITWIFGGNTVTADIFNWLATHWLPNIIFFIVFMIFAASFFGAFEITLPSSLVNKSDQKSDKAGLAGIFFMALTLVLVSFSCTGPIVGTVLIKSTQGEFWTPMVTMLAFSTAFALPFTIFALFPSLLKKLKSGSWLNSVKVVLGFIEVALGLKFLSMADQTYHWGILDREIYLAIWIAVFTLLGLYLLGKIRFEADSKVEHIGVFRLSLVIIDFAFVIYMIPGMFGAPLQALSGYLPPLESQDFVIWNKSDGSVPSANAEESTLQLGNAELPLGLTGFHKVEEGLEAAAKAGKPVFLDFTGLACVNCREMEQRVWSDTRVLSLLKNEFVIVALHLDDKTKVPESEWVTADNGKVLKDVGRINSHYARKNFGINAQPNYAILSPKGDLLVPVRGYNLDVDAYIEFLQSGIKAYKEISPNW